MLTINDNNYNTGIVVTEKVNKALTVIEFSV